MNPKLARQIISLLDLTRLEEHDTSDAVAEFCKQATTPIGNVAAVCIHPEYVALAAELLKDTQIKIATVVNFPLATDSLEQIINDITNAIANGANEIDLVIPYHQYLENQIPTTTEIVSQAKAACGEKVLLKTILETGALQSATLIAQACSDAIAGGSDFLKTSTGKNHPGADAHAVEILLQAILQHSEKNIGLKISGGVKTWQQAETYLQQISKYFPPEWIKARHLRFGASSLLGNILQAL